MLRQTWPLIVYTILTQCAVGLCVFLAAHLWFFAGGSADAAILMARSGLMAACVLVGLGIALSGMHLGKPMRAYRAIVNIRSSWLSREIMATGILFCLIVACCLAGLIGIDAAPYRWLVTATAFCGLSTIMIMAYAYSKAGKDAWAGYGPHALFLASTLVMGAAGMALLAAAIDAAQMAERGMLGLAMCLSFGVLAAALGRGKVEYRYKVTVTGSALSLMAVVMLCVAALSGTPEKGVFLPAFAAAILLSGELIGRYAFMGRGLVEHPESSASFGMVFKDLLFRSPFRMTPTQPERGAAEWSHSEGGPDLTPSACACPDEVDGYAGSPAAYAEPPQSQPEAATIQSAAETVKGISGATMGDAALTATLEVISVEDFFTTFLPGKSADLIALLKSIDLSFMAGKDFRCQFDIDGQVYSVILTNGNVLDFIKGAIDRPHVMAKVTEKDWRDAITGKFNSAAKYYTGDITSLLDAKRYKAVVTLKGGLNLGLKLDDGRVLALKAIFNGAESPSVDLSLALKDYLAVLSKTVSTQALIITNKVRFKGNMMLLLKFQNLL